MVLDELHCIIDGGGVNIVIDRFDPKTKVIHDRNAVPGDLYIQCCIKKNSAKCGTPTTDVYTHAITVC